MAKLVESAHGQLTQVDTDWTGPRFMALLAGTLIVALVIIYGIASYKFGDPMNYHLLAHDPVQHVFESSTMDL